MCTVSSPQLCDRLQDCGNLLERSLFHEDIESYLTIRGCSLPSFDNELVTGCTSGSRAVVLANSVEYATSIWSTANALSNGLTGTCGLLSSHTKMDFCISTHIAAIDDLLTQCIWVVGPGECVSSNYTLSATSRTNSKWSEPSAKMEVISKNHLQKASSVYPGLYVTAVSKGIPRMAMSKSSCSFSKHRKYGRWENDRGPEKLWSNCGPYFSSQVLSDCWLPWVKASCSWSLSLCWWCANEPRQKPVITRVLGMRILKGNDLQWPGLLQSRDSTISICAPNRQQINAFIFTPWRAHLLRNETVWIDVCLEDSKEYNPYISLFRFGFVGKKMDMELKMVVGERNCPGQSHKASDSIRGNLFQSSPLATSGCPLNSSMFCINFQLLCSYTRLNSREMGTEDSSWSTIVSSNQVSTFTGQWTCCRSSFSHLRFSSTPDFQHRASQRPSQMSELK